MPSGICIKNTPLHIAAALGHLFFNWALIVLCNLKMKKVNWLSLSRKITIKKIVKLHCLVSCLHETFAWVKDIHE
jgi:hypothetical protein